ncbi:MAG: hypothetical protein JW939_01635 [Candidatus Thermoplasmatota archaeon]|nr:hypothetical protein [Candidatus Thermoplasmatota archaeon]
MILPKGTVEFKMTGGENAVEDVIGRIKSNDLTGYVLVLGKLRKNDEELQDVTGQLVFKKGGAVLCETVITTTSKKGKEGIFPLLKAMMMPQSSIEFKSKIDVDPPLAFFKECSIDDSMMDIEVFTENMRAEEEERRKMEEEKRRREGRRAEIEEGVSEWLSEGYVIPSFPNILNGSFEEMDDWYNDLCQRMDRIDGYHKWLTEIDEVEVEKQKFELIDLMKKPEDMLAIESARTRFQDSLQLVKEKRGEIQKWVNLWKEEGYNTIIIEEKLEEDLTTAWNAMAEFMDHLQHLKDSREELDSIKEMDGAEGFGPEIRDIDLLLNDPDELDHIKRLIENLKSSIIDEKMKKETLMDQAREMESQGYSMNPLKDLAGGRLKPLQEMFNLMMNNIQRIAEMKEELGGLDRRDIPDEIDDLISSARDPMDLDSYEGRLIEIKDRISGFDEAREGIMSELWDLEREGYVIDDLDGKAELSVDALSSYRDEVVTKVSLLRDLADKLRELDSRWVQDEIEEAETALHDPSRIEWLKERIGRIQEKIDIREKKRMEVKDDLASWMEEGFSVERLREVIEEDLQQFIPVWEEFKGRIEGARELLGKLSGMDVRYFRKEAGDVKALINDPFELDNARRSLEELEKTLEKDHRLRNGLQKRMSDLKKEGWSLKGIEGILDTEPERLEDVIDDIESKVSRLSGALEEIASWDEIEKKNMQDRIKELKERLRDLQDIDGALDLYNELDAMVRSNMDRRKNIVSTLSRWEDAGYMVGPVAELKDGDIEVLSDSFEELKERIMELQQIQEEFDSMNRKHFPGESEEIEFRLNDPQLLEEIRKDIKALRSKIDADLQTREAYRRRIEDYMDQGFQGAERLSSFLDEELALVDLEFKNFAKDVDQFRKLKEKVGFVFRIEQNGPGEEDEEE